MTTNVPPAPRRATSLSTVRVREPLTLPPRTFAPTRSAKPGTLIYGGAILTLDDQDHFFPDGWVAVIDGRIAGVGAAPAPDWCERGLHRINAEGRLVLPGLVNAHTHLSQTFMRGLGCELQLPDWLRQYIQPIQRAMTPDDLLLSSMLGIVENLRSGVTTVVDHQKITQTPELIEAPLLAAQATGVRMVLARGWRDSGGRAEPIEEIEKSVVALASRWHEYRDGHLRIAIGPMEPYRCSAAGMARMAGLARSYDLRTQIHVAETADEVEAFVKQTSQTQIEWMQSLNLLDNRLQLVHCVHVTTHDMDLIAKSGAFVVHCPVSNARLSSGIAPLQELRKWGINVCLGTDGAASNDTQDMFETVKFAALAAKIRGSGSAVVPSSSLLNMASSVAARANGWPDLGQLKVGNRADIVVLELNASQSVVTGRPEDALVYGGPNRRARTVLVDGEIIVQDGKVLTVDETALQQASDATARQLFARAGIPPPNRELRLSLQQVGVS